jgi:hypothetical protein
LSSGGFAAIFAGGEHLSVIFVVGAPPFTLAGHETSPRSMVTYGNCGDLSESEVVATTEFKPTFGTGGSGTLGMAHKCALTGHNGAVSLDS